MHFDWFLILDVAVTFQVNQSRIGCVCWGGEPHDAVGCIDCFQQMVRAISNPGGF